MNRYIIEIDAGKIFSYEVADDGKHFGCRLLRPHGDRFYAAGDWSAYWDWFAGETAAAEPDICFVCPETERLILERLKDAALNCFKHAEPSTWKRSELKKFFSIYRDEPTAENFSWDATNCLLTFSDGKIFFLAGLSTFALHDNLEPKNSSSSKSKFKVKVYQPPAQVPEKISEPEKSSEPEKNIPQASAEPVEPKEKISAEDLRSFIDEQTNEQCADVSIKS